VHEPTQNVRVNDVPSQVPESGVRIVQELVLAINNAVSIRYSHGIRG
jgi:hypothetical protein